MSMSTARGRTSRCRRFRATRFIPPQSAEVVEGIRSLAAGHPEHLSVRQREMFESIAAEYDLHVERQRQWAMAMRP